MSASQVLPLAFGTVGLAAVGIAKLRTVNQPTAIRSMATAHDMHALTPREVARTARRLRTIDGNNPADHGIALGTLVPHGPALRASWEESALAIMAPRSGKTTALAIPAVLEAPGPVIATSNKRDLWDATHNRRDSHTWTFDPQHVVGIQQDWWWNPLGNVDNVEDAYRFASHFLGTIDDEGKRDIWSQGARDLIAGYALAAHHDHKTILDVHDWLCRPHITEPVDILNRNHFPQLAQSILDKMRSPDKTRASFYVTATTAMQCLTDPRITMWVTHKPGGRQFNPYAFAHTNETLHLLSKDGGGSAAPLVAAFTDTVLRAASYEAKQNSDGRLDPPLVFVGDEAANVCRIADLPKLYSHLGSRGIFLLTILQSYAQGSQAWGHTGIKELWGAATVKLVGPGMDDASFTGDLSRLIGEHDVPTTTYGTGRGGSSRNRSMRRDRIMGPAEIRALRKGWALLFVTGSKPALVKLQPWYEDKRWRDG